MRTAMLLAPHAARTHALLAAGLPRTLLVIAVLVALCIAAAAAVRLEGTR